MDAETDQMLEAKIPSQSPQKSIYPSMINIASNSPTGTKTDAMIPSQSPQHSMPSLQPTRKGVFPFSQAPFSAQPSRNTLADSTSAGVSRKGYQTGAAVVAIHILLFLFLL